MQPDLASGIQHHVNGRLDLAGQTYRAVLAHNPRHAEALHLLGVLAHQQGDYPQACAFICRAIEIQPGVPAFYSNLAEAYRATGQLEWALACCQTALALQPDSPEAANNL